MSRETTAIIYTRPTVPKGWGWDDQHESTTMLRRQEEDCRAYAERNGLEVDSVVVAPYDSAPIDQHELTGVGHIIVASCEVLPNLGKMATLCGQWNVHLHDASSGSAVTNWKPTTNLA